MKGIRRQAQGPCIVQRSFPKKGKTCPSLGGQGRIREISHRGSTVVITLTLHIALAWFQSTFLDFPGGPVVKTCNAGDADSICCRKGEVPYRAPRVGSCLTLGKELSKETHVLTKQEILLGKGTRVESRKVREPRRTALPSVWVFMVMGLVSGWSLASHSHSESFLVVHALLSQDGC